MAVKFSIICFRPQKMSTARTSSMLPSFDAACILYDGSKLFHGIDAAVLFLCALPLVRTGAKCDTYSFMKHSYRRHVSWEV